MSLCTFMTMLVLNLHHKGNQVPRWVRLFILQGLGTLMCMRSTIDLKRSHPRNVNNFKVRIKKIYTVILSNFFCLNDKLQIFFTETNKAFEK